MKTVGIVGCGRIAYRHVDAVLNTGLYEIKWIYDIKPEMAQRMASYIEEKAGNKPLIVSSTDEAIDVDVVSITTPNAFHLSSIQQFWEKGKTFVVEKPAVMNSKEFSILERLSFEKTIYISHQLRYLPIYKYTKELINKGSLGNLSHVVVNMWWNRSKEYFEEASWRGTWQYDGGMLFNQGIHLLDLAIYFVGGDVKSVDVLWTNKTHSYIEADDVALGYIQMNNGTLISINATISSQPKNIKSEIAVFGELGTVVIDNHQFTHFYVPDVERPELQMVPSYYGHMKLYEDVHNGKGITVNDIKPTMEALFQIYGR